MTQLEELQAFYRDGTDPFFVAQPNHVFIKQPVTGERVVLVPGHFYTFQELHPVMPDAVPTVDEVEMMRYPGKSEDSLMQKYTGIKKPYYDNRPIFLYLGNDFGLDVKLMNQRLRKTFVRSYLSRIQRPLAQCFDNDGKLLDFGKRIRMSELNPIFGVTAGFVKSITGLPDIKFDLLVNKYRREGMRYLTLIDWPDVPKLHLANYSTDKSISSRSYFSLLEIK